MSLISFTALQDGVTGVDAAATNNPLNTIYNDYNGNITDANIASGAAIAGTKLNLIGSKAWQYLGSATYTGGTVTSVGATPTLITNLTFNASIPSGATAVRITVDTTDLYAQTGAAVVTLAIFSGTTAGALTTQIGSSAPNVPSGSADPGHAVALILSPNPGSIYYSAAIYAGSSNARIDSSTSAPALITVEVC